MVKKAQDIQAAFEVEGNQYGNPPDSTLYHLGLLDTFDPRAVAMNITPVPSIGQSTDAHHTSGPIDVTLPLKVACQGTGWQELLGNAIGRTHIDADETSTGDGAPGGDGIDAVHSLTTDVYSHAILAKDLSTNQHTLCTGVVVNEATLEADYTTGGYITLDAACTALYSEDADNGDFTFNQNDAYNGVPFPSAPSADPLLPTNMTLSYSTATVDGIRLNDTAGNYVEVGERYMRFFTEADALDTDYAQNADTNNTLVENGVLDLGAAGYDSGDKLVTLVAAINAHSGGSPATKVAGNTVEPQNLLKGIYKMIGSDVTIPIVNSTTTTLTEFSNLKTVSLKIANNNTPIPGKLDGKWLQNSKIARGKADITLDITMTPENEDLYDLYRNETTLPLVRLDFGAGNGSIALTNGTITSFTRPLTGGAEVVDTLSIKFRGNGDYRNYSAFAISADFTLQ
tara:strand:+ start:39 stop:1403 length:1365 start_codon:yes stop_codon:yes gene_type:complete